MGKTSTHGLPLVNETPVMVRKGASLVKQHLLDAHKNEVSCTIVPKDCWFVTAPLCMIVLLFFRLVETCVSIAQCFGKYDSYTGLAIRSIGSRTMITRTNSLSRKDSSEILDSWLPTEEISDERTTRYTYQNFADAVESLLVSASFAGHAKLMAYLVVSDKDAAKTAAQVVEVLKQIKMRARKSVKFRFLFRLLVQFLDDIEKSRASSVTEFVQALARDMLERPSYWYMSFIHKHCRASQTPRHVYETALGTLALFFREGAGMEAYMLRDTWKSGSRVQSAVLTLLMYCAVEKCTPTSVKEINVTEFSGVERIFLARGSKESFHRYVSRTSTKSSELFKDKMMWDITLNCCNEFVESCWSTDALERAVWALQHCRNDEYKDMYYELEKLNGQRNLDLTHLRAEVLVGLSVTGMVRFHGTNDCVYRATGDARAKVVLHGNLPMPCVAELVRMNIIRKDRMGLFQVGRLPGSQKKFRAVRIADRIGLTESAKCEAFSCELRQKVG